MKPYAYVLVAAVLTWGAPAYCCSPADLTQKLKAVADASKAAFARDPGRDEARKAQVQGVIERYRDLKNSSGGGYIIDMLCKQNDELLAIYQ